MRDRMLSTVVRLGLVLALGAAAELSAQSDGAPTPACALLSGSEVRQATGIQGYRDGYNLQQEGKSVGGGSSCQFGTRSPTGSEARAPLLSLVLIRGKGWTEKQRASKLPANCKREPVSVGDAAFFETCPTRSNRTAPLYVKAGANDVILLMDVEPPATEASVRPLVVNVAKTAVAKLAKAR